MLIYILYCWPGERFLQPLVFQSRLCSLSICACEGEKLADSNKKPTFLAGFPFTVEAIDFCSRTDLCLLKFHLGPSAAGARL